MKEPLEPLDPWAVALVMGILFIFSILLTMPADPDVHKAPVCVHHKEAG